MGGATAGETVPLDHSLKALALAGADDVVDGLRNRDPGGLAVGEPADRAAVDQALNPARAVSRKLRSGGGLVASGYVVARRKARAAAEGPPDAAAFR